MDQSDVLEKLKHFVRQDVLKGKKVEIDAETPLLESGILNSMEVIRTIKFIQDAFGVKMPATKVTGENFQNLRQLTRIVVSLAESHPASNNTSRGTTG
jgi:acyl carrier protein